MMLRARIVATTLALSLLPALACASAESSGTLAHGGAYVVQPDATASVSSVALWFRAPAAGYDNATPGLSRLAATAAATTPLASGKSLVALVRSLGGRLTIDVTADLVSVSVVAPASASRRVVASLSAAYFQPSIDEDALRAAQRDVAVIAAERRYSSDDVLHDLLYAQLFQAGPAHEPPVPATVADLVKVPLADVQAYAQRAFRSANATVALAGNVDGSVLDAVTDGTAGTPDAPVDSVRAKSPEPTSRAIGDVSGIGIAWTGPSIADERAATALDFVSDYLFRDGTGVVAKSLDATGDAYINGQFITMHDPGVMLVTIGGTHTEAVQTAVIDAVRTMDVPLDPAAFAAAREAFLFHLAVDAQTPPEQTDNLGWYAAEGSLAYAPSDQGGDYWKIAQGLDPAYVAGVVKRYLDRPIVVHLITSPAKEQNS